MEIKALILGMQSQLSCIPSLNQTVQAQASKLSVLEARTQKLEAGSGSGSGAAESIVAPASLLTGTSSIQNSLPSPCKWLAGGFKSTEELQTAKKNIEGMHPTFVDSWHTKGERPLLFITLRDEFDRLALHMKAQTYLRENFPHVWGKLGRTRQEEHEHTKAIQFKQLLRNQIKEKEITDVNEDELGIKSKDSCVLWKQERLARFQNGVERYNWKVLQDTFQLTKQQVLDGMVALDEQP